MSHPMTTEYRPLLTAAEVVAALRAGEIVEFLSTIDDARWARTSYAADTPTHDDSCLSRDIARGFRYRARPAEDVLPEPSVDWKATAEVARAALAPQAAEIEALRKRYAEMDAAYLHEAGACMDAIARAEAAEARATRLESILRNCRGYVLNVLARERAVTLGCESSSTRECEHDIAEIDAALGPGGGA